jgi:hypothetical protein
MTAFLSPASRPGSPGLGLFLVLVVALSFTAPAPAAEPMRVGPANHSAAAAVPTPTQTSCLVLADDDGWSFRKLFSGFNNRTRVVQLCVVAMCLALFILMKK